MYCQHINKFKCENYGVKFRQKKVDFCDEKHYITRDMNKDSKIKQRKCEKEEKKKKKIKRFYQKRNKTEET